MAEVHPTAILEGEIDLADGVTIGPHCVLIGAVAIGKGSRLIGSVYINGPATVGERNVVYPFVCLGFAPQSVVFDPQEPGRGLRIGDDNTFREGVTIHRAMTDDGPTTIGEGNYFMTTSHVGHDCIVGNNCIIASSAMLGGHVRVDDRVNIGGGTAIHQFVRVGRGAMLSGGMATGLDVLPFFMLTGVNITGGVNLVGMRRNGMSRDDIDTVRWIYRIICRSGLTPRQMAEALEDRGGEPLVREYLEFIQASRRGICTARAKESRGAVPGIPDAYPAVADPAAD